MQIKIVRVVFLVDDVGERIPMTILEDTGGKAYKNAKGQIRMTLNTDKEIDSTIIPVYPAASLFSTLYNLDTREKLE